MRSGVLGGVVCWVELCSHCSGAMGVNGVALSGVVGRMSLTHLPCLPPVRLL